MAQQVTTNTKWGKIIDNFLKSDKEIIKIYDPISSDNMVRVLHNYLYVHHEDRVKYTRRGNELYIFRVDVTQVTPDEAMEGIYLTDY